MTKSIAELHQSAVRVSKNYLSSERELITILDELDTRRVYRELGYPSLHAYAPSALGLSDEVAYVLIKLARTTRAVPELRIKLETQAISITNARLIAPILKLENSEVWLSKAEVLSKRELEKELVKSFPERAVLERARPVAEGRMKLEVGISDELHQQLTRVKDLLSQRLGKTASMEEALNELTKEYLDRRDPVKKAERAALRTGSNTDQPAKIDQTSLVPGRKLGNVIRKGRRSGERRPIPAAIRHAVQRRDQGRCTRHDSLGQRCKSRRFLHFHHSMPVSLGGADTVANLSLLCSSCHALEHSKEGFQFPFVEPSVEIYPEGREREASVPWRNNQGKLEKESPPVNLPSCSKILNSGGDQHHGHDV